MTPKEIKEKAIELCRGAGFDPYNPTCDIWFPDDPDAGYPWASYRYEAAKELGIEWPETKEPKE